MEKMNLNVKGMHCSSCEKLIQMALEDIGVKAKADNRKGIVSVEFDPSKSSLKKIKESIEKEGYKVA
ncbi:MAG: heavy-metal-associated domain-containing protein [Candidatus Aenigmarchaeota archaeon]|nr:heavy-metal-associated domain-containing protein [Candidatus Aenigmarchaeota archaeon]